MDVTRCGKNFANINIYQLGKTTYWGATSGTNVTLNNDQNFAVLAFKLPTGSFKLVCNNPNIYKITRGITTKYSTIDLNVHYNAFIGYRNYSWGSYSPYQLYNDTIIIDGDADAILLQVKMVENNVPITSSLLEHLQISCVMISENDEYIAYSGTTIPFDWSSTAGILYGGYIDLINGELVRDWVIDTHEIGANDGTPGGAGTSGNTNYRFIAWNLASAHLPDSDRKNQAVCNILPYDTEQNGSRYWIGGGTVYMILPNDGKSYSVTIAYPERPLNTTKYSLNSSQLKTLRGTNNIWSNAGPVEIKYWTH